MTVSGDAMRVPALVPEAIMLPPQPDIANGKQQDKKMSRAVDQPFKRWVGTQQGTRPCFNRERLLNDDAKLIADSDSDGAGTQILCTASHLRAL